MYNLSFSKVCYHDRSRRINQTAVKCLDCGQVVINKLVQDGNKTSKDFVKEHSHHNFNRNFSNDFVENNTNNSQIEYYSDYNQINNISVDRSKAYYTNPPKYNVVINGDTHILSDPEIKKILHDTNVKLIKIEK